VAARFTGAAQAAARRLWGCDVEAVHDPQGGRERLLARLEPSAPP
jgi:hypothetical protein